MAAAAALWGEINLLTGRSAPRLHPEILQSFGISVKLFQFVQRVHFPHHGATNESQAAPTDSCTTDSRRSISFHFRDTRGPRLSQSDQAA